MIVSFGQPYITFKVSADVTQEINASDLYERHLSSSCLENRKFLNLFNSDWEKLQSERLFLSAVKLFIKCCRRNMSQISGGVENDCTSISRYMEFAVRNWRSRWETCSLQAYTTTTRDFLASFYLIFATLITALRCSTLVNIAVITTAASLFTATRE